MTRAGRQAKSVPTEAEIQNWPATVSVAQACCTLGISRSYGYELIKTGEFPYRVLTLGGRYVVVTSSIVDVLSGGVAA